MAKRAKASWTPARERDGLPDGPCPARTVTDVFGPASIVGYDDDAVTTHVWGPGVAALSLDWGPMIDPLAEGSHTLLRAGRRITGDARLVAQLTSYGWRRRSRVVTIVGDGRCWQLTGHAVRTALTRSDDTVLATVNPLRVGAGLDPVERALAMLADRQMWRWLLAPKVSIDAISTGPPGS